MTGLKRGSVPTLWAECVSRKVNGMNQVKQRSSCHSLTTRVTSGNSLYLTSQKGDENSSSFSRLEETLHFNLLSGILFVLQVVHNVNFLCP